MESEQAGPAVDDPTLPRLRFDGHQASAAGEAWGCNCGPAAIAAACSVELAEMAGYCRSLQWPGYTNPTMGCALLKSLGVRWGKARGLWPGRGVARIQWMGPWMDPGVPAGARYQRTHWVAACWVGRRRAVFDVNHFGLFGRGWVWQNLWEQVTVPAILEGIRRADGGWMVTHGYEIGGRGG